MIYLHKYIYVFILSIENFFTNITYVHYFLKWTYYAIKREVRQPIFDHIELTHHKNFQMCPSILLSVIIYIFQF